MPHPEILAALKPDALVLIDDGKVRLRVVTTDGTSAETIVEAGDELSDHKGLGVPGLRIPLPALTEKDRVDLAFALRLGVDWIALSFVQHPQDMAELRRLVDGRAAVMAKIEKPSALDHIDEILDLSDGIMVARGRPGGGAGAGGRAGGPARPDPRRPRARHAGAWSPPRCWSP